MGNNRIEEILKQFIIENFLNGEDEGLSNQLPLLTSGIIDSITALELVDFIEQQFGIEFQAQEVDQENLNDIQTLAAFIERKIQDKEAAA